MEKTNVQDFVKFLEEQYEIPTEVLVDAKNVETFEQLEKLFTDNDLKDDYDDGLKDWEEQEEEQPVELEEEEEYEEEYDDDDEDDDEK